MFINKLLNKFWLKIKNNIQNEALFKKVIKGGFWSFFGGAFTYSLVLVSSFFLVRILGKITFGQLAAIRSTVNTFSVFGALGLETTSAKFISENKENKSKIQNYLGLIIIITFIFSILVSLVSLFFSSEIVTYFFNDYSLITGFQLAIILLFTRIFIVLQTGILYGFEAYKVYAKVNFFVGIISLPTIIICTYYGALIGAIIGFAVSNLINILFNLFSILTLLKDKQITINYKDYKTELNTIWEFSIPALLSGVLVSPINWLCYMFLVKSKDGFSEVAVFEIANQWRMMLVFVPATVGKVFLPTLSGLFGEKNNKDYKVAVKYSFLINSGLILFLSIIVILFSAEIMQFYGDEFANKNMTLILLAISSILIVVNSVIGQIIASKNKMWLGLTFNFFWAIALLVSSYYFITIKNMGSIGLAYGNLVSYLLLSLIQILFIMKTEKSIN